MYFSDWTIEEEFEDANEVIRISKSKHRQYNGQKKKDKITKSDLQNTTQKTKDRDTNLTIIRENSGAPEGTHIVLI